MNSSTKIFFFLLLSVPLFLNSQKIYAKNGHVKIKYELKRYSIIASNQLAIWIKDAKGNYITTLYATDFMARGGYKKRKECCPVWRSESNWENASNNEIDTVSGATQQPGLQEVTWDCTDKNGKKVNHGIYSYQIEINVFWDERILYSGKIEIGNGQATSKAEIKYFHTKDKDKKKSVDKMINKSGIIIENVEATYYPE